MIVATAVVNPPTAVDNPATTPAIPAVAPAVNNVATESKPRNAAIIEIAVLLELTPDCALLAVDCASVPAFFASIILWFNPDGSILQNCWPNKLIASVPCVSICFLEYSASSAAVLALSETLFILLDIVSLIRPLIELIS